MQNKNAIYPNIIHIFLAYYSHKIKTIWLPNR